MGYGERKESCGNFIRISLMIVNLVIFIGGLVVFSIGVYTLVERSFMTELLGSNLYTGTVYVLVVTSALVCILSFFGCMGAAREIKCLLLTYSILLFLIFVTMLLGGILGYVFREKVASTMRQEMFSSMKFYGGRREITAAWDDTQTKLGCCGVESYNDWKGRIPESCCQETYGNQRQPCRDNPSSSTVFNRGCLQVSTEFMRRNASQLGLGGIIVAIIMIFGMAFSCYFFRIIE